MRGIDLQIQFERIIQEMNEAFLAKERPDTFTVYKFINQAQIRHLNEKYIGFDTVKDNVEYIEGRAGDLNSLIKTRVFSSSPAPAGPYYQKAKYITLSDDYVYYVRSDSYLKRTEAIPIITAAYIPNKIVSYSDLERLLKTPWNYPILRNPVVVFEENNRIYIIHDSYTNSLGGISLTYLRRPYNFDTNYEEFNHSTTVISVPAGTKMRAITEVQYITSEWQSIGTYIIKQTGFNSINGTVCTPYDTIDITTECEFPYQVHDEILNLAVKMYIEEAKFRLNIRAAEKQQVSS